MSVITYLFGEEKAMSKQRNRRTPQGFRRFKKRGQPAMTKKLWWDLLNSNIRQISRMIDKSKINLNIDKLIEAAAKEDNEEARRFIVLLHSELPDEPWVMAMDGAYAIHDLISDYYVFLEEE